MTLKHVRQKKSAGDSGIIVKAGQRDRGTAGQLDSSTLPKKNSIHRKINSYHNKKIHFAGTTFIWIKETD